MLELGKRIKEKRVLLGLTQEELAEKMGYKNKSTIAKIEMGNIDIPQSKVFEFARVLDTSVVYLMNLNNVEIDGENRTDFEFEIQDDSMEPRMCKGDVVIAKQDAEAKSGDVVIVEIGKKERLCRRFRKYRDGIELVSNNPSYEPVFVSNEEMKKDKIYIIGKVVELHAKL